MAAVLLGSLRLVLGPVWSCRVSVVLSAVGRRAARVQVAVGGVHLRGPHAPSGKLPEEHWSLLAWLHLLCLLVVPVLASCVFCVLLRLCAVRIFLSFCVYKVSLYHR